MRPTQRSFAIDCVVVLHMRVFEPSCRQGEAAIRASQNVQHMVYTESDRQERVLRKGRHRFLGHIDGHWSVERDNNSAMNERQDRRVVGAPGGRTSSSPP